MALGGTGGYWRTLGTFGDTGGSGDSGGTLGTLGGTGSALAFPESSASPRFSLPCQGNAESEQGITPSRGAQSSAGNHCCFKTAFPTLLSHFLEVGGKYSQLLESYTDFLWCILGIN